ncbi:GNAT family N-acetyltransferase [Chryseolinea lacunae]|uniref:GNAT family N-acetyltransferase n=1 Tax=Chryseolinea lacunae TaxID=2801331 RepID=A0ABS1KZM2_9BACT|nr:GNAT family N-acetyltransferase [Chryseolinea lacunae]MBL0744914.1 GNAT family N-acetyltransferase [Chryseolinea lacunae]
MVRLDLPEHFFTDRLSVQRLRYEDAEEIFYAYASKQEATQFISWPTHRTMADTESYLRYAVTAWNVGTDYSFSIRLRESRRLIGSFGVINEEGKLQFGYIFSPTQWGNGYATEVCRAMMPLLRDQYGVYRIQSFVDADNIASARVLEKSGLIEEARLPGWFRFVNQRDKVKDCIHYRLPLEKIR